MKPLRFPFVRHVGWFLLGLYLFLGAMGLTLQFVTGTSFGFTTPPLMIGQFLAYGVWAMVGALLIFRQPRHPVGWLFAMGAIISTLDGLAFGYAHYGSITHPGSLPGVAVMIVWLNMTGRVVGTLSGTLLLLLFPNGRPLSKHWGKVAWLSAGAVLIYMVASALSPLSLLPTSFPTDLLADQLGLEERVLPVVELVTWAAWGISVLCFVAAIVSLFVRLHRARGIERQQLKWFTYSAAFFVPGLFLVIVGVLLAPSQASIATIFAGWFLLMIFFAGVPIASLIAILRYRLWDIDIIIRRTLQYSIVSVLLAAIYFGSITLIQWGITAVTQTESPSAIVLSTLLIAALFNPLRHRVQTVIDRRFYRQQYDAAQVLAQFAQTIRDEVEMDALTTELGYAIQETMQPEMLVVWLKEPRS